MNFTESKECSPKAHLLNHYETVQPVLLTCMACGNQSVSTVDLGGFNL